MAGPVSYTATVVATWMGCGYFPKGPGTAGSIAALVCALPMAGHIGWAALALLPAAIWAADAHAKVRNAKDPQEVVVDEVAGQWITLAGAVHLHGWLPWILALIVFRCFDILKPPPVRQLEKLPGGWGVVCDDVMAGIYGAVVMRVLGWNNLY
jgi:phosphatidylglycerophosphatase A